MSIEVIPEPYRQPFNPIADVDHDLVRLYTQGRLTTGRGVKKEIQRIYSFNRFYNEELMERLLAYGKFLEPFDDELEPVDESYSRMRIFFGGVSVALATTANMAFELDIDQNEWRQTWAALPAGIDAPMSVKPGELKTPDDCFRVGAALMDVGNRNLAGLEPTYQDMIEELDAGYSVGGMHGNIFRASYGFAFGIGRKVLRDIMYPEAVEAAVIEAIPDADELATAGQFDDEYRQLLIDEAQRV